MAYLKSSRAMSGPAAYFAPRFADLETLRALPGVSKLVSFHPDYTTISAGEIVSVVNHADAADPLQQSTDDRGPVSAFDPVLGRETAVFSDAQNRFLQSLQGFDWSGAYTVAAVCRVTEVEGDLFQNIVGDFAGTTPDTAGIVVQHVSGENRMVHRVGTLPGGANYARALYTGGAWCLVIGTSDGVSVSALSLNGAAFDTQTIATLPGAGVTDFLVGHNVGGNGMEGAVDFVIGVEGHDWSATENAERLALLKRYVTTAYGTLVPLSS